MMNIWEDRNWSPMLLGEIEEPFDSKNHIFELKFDGIRAIAFVSPKEVKIYNRRKIEITYLYPELNQLKELVNENTIFDGEIIMMEGGKPSFGKLQERAHLKDPNKINIQTKINPVIFACFDVLYANKNLTNKTLLERKKVLENYRENDVFIKCKFIENNGIKLFETIKRNNLEGIVSKRKDSTYEIGKRTNTWLKIKNIKEEKFIIGGYTEKEAGYVISVLFGEYRNDKFYYVGKAFLGKKTALYKKIKKEKIINKSPFLDFNKELVNYIYPSLKCTVNYLEKTKNGNLRQPFIKNESK